MTSIPPNVEARMIELLSDRAVGSLSTDEVRELEGLLQSYPELDTDVLDVAAAAVHLAYEGGPYAPLPANIAARVAQTLTQNNALTVVDPRALDNVSACTSPIAGVPSTNQAGGALPVFLVSPPPEKVVVRARWSPLAYAGWAAAAVFFVVSAALFRASQPPAIPLANERARLMALPDTVQTSFAALKDESATRAQGDVVWSTREQRGFMRFRGLEANPRGSWVYQLWIFDQAQDDRFPVDGGVFDIDPVTGDVLVPIQAKIKINKPTQFVVTVEKPGGVVVSTRGRVAMAAKI